MAHDKFLFDLFWASSRLEGNTYSLLETERLIAFGDAAAGKTPFETQLVLNHKAAIEFLVVVVDEIGLDRRTLIDCVGEAVRQVSRGDANDTENVFLPLAKDLVTENDREQFLKIAKEEIAALHEGNFARYRLRPSEFKGWQKRKI